MGKQPEQEARKILRRFNLQPPVDVYAAARGLLLEVVERDLEPYISGLLSRKGQRGVIVVNANHHPNRQRFTIAHECGHFVLHESDERFVDAATVPVVYYRDERSSEGLSQMEIEANTFAAELLMPQEALFELLRGSPVDAFDDNAIRRLATHFNVSQQALTIRLSKLNLIQSWAQSPP